MSSITTGTDRTTGHVNAQLHAKSVEFETVLGDKGGLVVPAALLKHHGLKGGTKVHVRLTEHALSSRLHRRGVTEEEIERIAGLQLEPREQVVKFLLSEGVLRDRWQGKRRRPHRTNARRR